MKFRFLMVEMIELEWDELSTELINQYGRSILLSWRMRTELGCVRRHGYVNGVHVNGDFWPRDRVFLDFFDEISYTTFILRYS